MRSPPRVARCAPARAYPSGTDYPLTQGKGLLYVLLVHPESYSNGVVCAGGGLLRAVLRVSRSKGDEK